MVTVPSNLCLHNPYLSMPLKIMVHYGTVFETTAALIMAPNSLIIVYLFLHGMIICTIKKNQKEFKLDQFCLDPCAKKQAGAQAACTLHTAFLFCFTSSKMMMMKHKIMLMNNEEQ